MADTFASWKEALQVNDLDAALGHFILNDVHRSVWNELGLEWLGAVERMIRSPVRTGFPAT